MEVLRELPSKDELEWFISDGKDRKGVAVRFHPFDSRLVPDYNFAERVRRWEWDTAMALQTEDRYSVREMPTLDLLNDYLQGKAIFNLRTGRIE